MQVSLETTSGLERRLTVGVPAQRIEDEVNKRLQQASKNVRLDGFRPGKVPFKVIRQRFGEGVRREVIGEVMGQTYQEAIMQEKLRPAGQPSIEPKQLDAGKDLEYVATFEVFPEVEARDLKETTIERHVAEVTDEDVDNIIEIFRKQQGSMQEVERAAAEGDTVIIDYLGKKDGEPFDGGAANDSSLELGSGRMIPGFEDGIVGLKAGDEKTLELSFPEDYHNDDLKGAAVTFDITVKAVKEQVLAPMDESLFEQYGVTEGGEEKFREEIAGNMKRELKNAVTASVKKQVMDAVLATYEDVAVPKALVDQEIKAMRQQMFQQFGGAPAQGLDLESLLPAEMFVERAEPRVKLGLVLATLVSEYNIKPDADRVRETIEEIASTYEDPEEVVNYYYSNQEQLNAIENRVLEDQVVEKLQEQLKVEDKACSYQEAISAGQAANAN
ncbi:Cell division trigger factor [Aequoribacter fuscus]|uniref:Trigger factor n=1 Tax=Aequoribacter fuscus TaxID=2518989 RepID=F3L159_9GAMM|nr:trigger factor [Aequoribacter fuscus]EGG30004.1 Cell division trigger factor [Aequoribacter fuscus]QHJ88010.1 trigger factor [Aequoribacter fuscus]